MFLNNLNPTLLKIGFLEIRYYGLVYVVGLLVAYFILDYYIKKGEIELTKEKLWDFIFYSTLGVIIGARLFLILWEPSFYLKNPLELLKVWKGGMSFHGGLVGILIVGLFYCKKNKLNFLKLADILSIPLILILAVGRIANFINNELYGIRTNVWWCVNFRDVEGCRHPAQLYDGLKRFIIFGILIFLNKKEHKEGFIFWIFILLEGFGRIIVDFFREEIRYLTLTIGQWLSIPMVLIGLYYLSKDLSQKH